MKKVFSFFLTCLLLISLFVDGFSYHHHEINLGDITSYQETDDCEKCLFSNSNSNSISKFEIKSNSFNYLTDSYFNSYKLENYFNPFLNKIYQRGPPA